MRHAENTHYQIKSKESILKSHTHREREREREREFIPVLANVWPLYDAHKRSSSSISSVVSSSLLYWTRSRKLCHSSILNDHIMDVKDENKII